MRELELAAERLVVEMLEKAAEDLVERKMEQQVEAQSEQMVVDKLMSAEESVEAAVEQAVDVVTKKEVKCRIHNANYNEGPWVCTCFESAGTTFVSKQPNRRLEKEEKKKPCRIHGAQIYGSDYNDRPFKCTCFD